MAGIFRDAPGSSPRTSSKTLHGLVGRMVEPSAHVITYGLISLKDMPGNTHKRWVISGRKGHETFHWVRFGILKPQVVGKGRYRANPSNSTAFARSAYSAISTRLSYAGTAAAVCERL